MDHHHDHHTPFALPPNHSYMMSAVYSSSGQQQPHSLDSNQSTGSSTAAHVASVAKDLKAVVTQTSSLPSSRRPSTNLTPGQMAAAIAAAQVPQRVFIRVPVKDVAIQTDFPEDHSLMSGSSASSSSTSSVRDHSELIEHNSTSTMTTNSTLTSHDQLSLNQLSSKEQQLLLQQAVQHLLNGLRQSMMAAQGSQMYQQQPAHFQSDLKNRASSVDHTNLLSQQSQSSVVPAQARNLPPDHSATISACASDVYQSELLHSPFAHQNHQTLPFSTLIQSESGSPAPDQQLPFIPLANSELLAMKHLLKQVCNTLVFLIA